MACLVTPRISPRLDPAHVHPVVATHTSRTKTPEKRIIVFWMVRRFGQIFVQGSHPLACQLLALHPASVRLHVRSSLEFERPYLMVEPEWMYVIADEVHTTRLAIIRALC
jgi:hypothetical protein